MLITTPYDEGWTVYLDGQRAEIYKGLGTFISFYISSGTHEIEMHYEPKGLKTGMLISSLSVLIFAAYALIDFIKRRKRQLSTEKRADEESPKPALEDEC